MNRLFKNSIIGTVAIMLFVFPHIVFAQWCIYQKDYMLWLCHNVKGAEQACSAPAYVGNFPDSESCNKARKAALPNDWRWQQMTECRQCGSARVPSISTSSGLRPGQQIQLQMFQSVMQPLFNALGQSIFNSMNSMNRTSPPEQTEAQLQEQKIRQEEEYKKAVEAWQNNLEQAKKKALDEAQRDREAGGKLLTRARIGNFGKLKLCRLPLNIKP